jgi:hypothetical protein
MATKKTVKSKPLPQAGVVKELEDKFNLLLEHLGIHFEDHEGKLIIKPNQK